MVAKDTKVRVECDLSVKVPSTVNFLVNDLRLWGLHLKLGGHNF